ncbi:hypothetical protein C8C87_2448 [Flavobacterium sp. 120]|nr:hypothetical protein C8C87_2448 [Flavobacterium sp. 120]
MIFTGLFYLKIFFLLNDVVNLHREKNHIHNCINHASKAHSAGFRVCREL